jgi:hypothetical protein
MEIVFIRQGLVFSCPFVGAVLAPCQAWRTTRMSTDAVATAPMPRPTSLPRSFSLLFSPATGWRRSKHAGWESATADVMRLLASNSSRLPLCSASGFCHRLPIFAAHLAENRRSSASSVIDRRIPGSIVCNFLPEPVYRFFDQFCHQGRQNNNCTALNCEVPVRTFPPSRKHGTQIQYKKMVDIYWIGQFAEETI